MSDTAYPAVQHMATHVLHHLSLHRSRVSTSTPPLFVAVQGPQGSGKTFLTSHLRRTLSATPHNLHVAVLSIDDVYLTHTGLRALADAHPENTILHGRGPPGTHDLFLGTKILRELKLINVSEGADLLRTVNLPIFDKSLNGGEGDRLPESSWNSISTPPNLDIVIIEGWCVGFAPISQGELEVRWERPVADLQGVVDFNLNTLFRKSDVEELNELLKPYVEWWNEFDVFIQISPPDSHPHAYIYEWRLQQEHAMKAKNGGRGMSDEQVKSFVDRYIPGYIFFKDGITIGSPDPGPRTEFRPPSWIGRGLRVVIGREREVIETHAF